jgi:uncharacterized protein YeaO (DUF488 family)
MGVQIARVYDEVGSDPRGRFLVDRLWPRGIAKATAPFERWLKDVAPSPDLRRWYSHDVDKYAEFAERYREELTDPAAQPVLDDLRSRGTGTRILLLTATKDLEHSSAAVLRDLLT